MTSYAILQLRKSCKGFNSGSLIHRRNLVGEAEQLINDLIEIIKDTLESGEEILISGFGKFKLREKESRPGREPNTGKQYEISARRVITFTPSDVWRQEINGEDS